jgi:hypothetical protein
MKKKKLSKRRRLKHILKKALYLSLKHGCVAFEIMESKLDLTGIKSLISSTLNVHLHLYHHISCE